MFDLYKAECRRFARWGVGIGAIHLAALLILDRLFPGLRENGEIGETPGLAAGLYALASVILGFYQAATYARMNHWIALLHRPLPPWRIMAGVIGAGATVVIAAILLPLALFTASVAMGVGRVVDVRHWLLVPTAATIGVIGFLVGSYVALAPRRYGWTVALAALLLTASNTAVGGGAPLFQGLVVAVLALLVLSAFKPDRTTAPGNPGLLALTGGVAALSIYILLVVGVGLGYQMTLVALGRNALVNTPPPGGLVEASRADSDDLIAAAVSAAQTREGAEVRARLSGARIVRLPIAQDALPTRGELTDAGSIDFVDGRRGIAWTFSHDANSFQGLRLKDRRPASELRPGGGFEAPPLPVGDGQMIAGGSLYRTNSATGTIERLLRLPGGELIVAKPAPVGTTVAILGNRALHFVDKVKLEGGRAADAEVAVPLPGAIGDLRRLDVAQLPERTIISFFFGRDSIEGPSAAWQRVLAVAPDGTIRLLAQRSLGPDFSNALRFRVYWLSPAFHVIAAAAEDIGAIDAPVQYRARVDVPRVVWIAAGVLSLIAAACAAAIARRRRIRPSELTVWTLAVLILGIPMLAAFLLIGKTARA